MPLQFPESEAQYWAWQDHAEKLLDRQIAQVQGLIPTDPVLVFEDAWLPEKLKAESVDWRRVDFRALAVHALRQHRYCGDAYPEGGWPDVVNALAQYALEKRKTR